MTSDTNDVWSSEVPQEPGFYWIKSMNTGKTFVSVHHGDSWGLGFLYGPRIPSAEQLAARDAELAELRATRPALTEEEMRVVREALQGAKKLERLGKNQVAACGFGASVKCEEYQIEAMRIHDKIDEALSIISSRVEGGGA